MKDFNSAIQNVCQEESLPLWKLAVKWTLQTAQEQTKNVILSAGIFLSSEINEWIRIFHLKWLLSTQHRWGKVRMQFLKYADTPPNTLQFYKDYIQMEFNALTPDPEAIR